MTVEDFPLAHLMFRRDIRRLAKSCADGDEDLRDDLEQEGLIALWQMEPERVFGRSKVWVKIRIWWQMQEFLRWLYGRTREVAVLGAVPGVDYG